MPNLERFCTTPASYRSPLTLHSKCVTVVIAKNNDISLHGACIRAVIISDIATVMKNPNAFVFFLAAGILGFTSIFFVLIDLPVGGGVMLVAAAGFVAVGRVVRNQVPAK